MIVAKKLSIVTRGLIEHFDFMDGKGTETTLKSRISERVATLYNSNFDSSGGWTGKGLKLDGVKDYVGINLSESFKYVEIGIKVESVISTSWNRMFSLDSKNMIMSLPSTKRFDFRLDNEILEQKYFQLKTLYNLNSALWKDKGFRNVIIGKMSNFGVDYSNIEICYIRFYEDILTPEEIQKNLEYEQSIDRNVAVAYPLLQDEKSYGIGLASQLTEEQLKTFRLSNDKTKFVAGLRYCEVLEVTKYTYSEILKVMETEEWASAESSFE